MHVIVYRERETLSQTEYTVFVCFFVFGVYVEIALLLMEISNSRISRITVSTNYCLVLMT
jgi:hypothetical protein